MFKIKIKRKRRERKERCETTFNVRLLTFSFFPFLLNIRRKVNKVEGLIPSSSRFLPLGWREGAAEIFLITMETALFPFYSLSIIVLAFRVFGLISTCGSIKFK